ncbi:uncharacterized protein LOC113500292 isoform X1 [Trichoplusia ni]|uniref:Uncharacterized protein LOC113500292 isoform X1 n=1 Tax=Trichoplusia ni TaxID=7111 RepID=A0A7E5W8K5_TRINI|nr:uncharacterized protein LOC113500292 isoform X1 [Trichoplusia ni]
MIHNLTMDKRNRSRSSHRRSRVSCERYSRTHRRTRNGRSRSDSRIRSRHSRDRSRTRTPRLRRSRNRRTQGCHSRSNSRRRSPHIRRSSGRDRGHGYVPRGELASRSVRTPPLSPVVPPPPSNCGSCNAVLARLEALEQSSRVPASEGPTTVGQGTDQIVEAIQSLKSEGDLVFVIKYAQSTGKLDHGMRGPYRVIRVLPHGRYELRLVAGSYGKTTFAAAQYMVPWEGEWTPESCAGFFEGKLVPLTNLCDTLEEMSWGNVAFWTLWRCLLFMGLVVLFGLLSVWCIHWVYPRPLEAGRLCKPISRCEMCAHSVLY